ncbi:MAG: hypothetical protein KY391_01230 [Actinobacteria bacterium]|nr:hypothetical protein [Actinomycetota bacterium]
MHRIAAVSRDDKIRLQLARAFDTAPASWIVKLHEDVPTDADVVVCGPDRYRDGYVLFDPTDPGKLIADIAARLATTAGRAIFVVGATGGCGASSVALHLAGISGGCLIEASGDDLRRRLAMPSAKSWGDVLEDEPIELSALPVAPGFRVLLAPPTATVDHVATVLERSLPVFDHAIVDVPKDGVAALAARGAIGVLVLAPTRPSAERARAIIDTHAAIRWAIVTNRLGPGSSLRRKDIEQLLQRKVAVELPCSAGLRDAEDDGSLLTSPLSPWLWQIKRLWRALATA